MNLVDFAKEVHQNAVDHGWWDEARSDAEVRVLIHSEWSEALEEYRAGRPMVWQGENGKPEGIAVELIDGCIRILDFLVHQGATCENDFDETINNAIEFIYEIGFQYDSRIMTLPELIDVLHHVTCASKELGNRYLIVALGTACAWLKEVGLVDWEALILEKHTYNKTRPYRHGGKKL